ncbi:MAG TPA: hypothetical protein VN903_17775, partial [Polyangia bacterium]|nr:hypothetical protein [Polyangia bacterium]
MFAPSVIAAKEADLNDKLQGRLPGWPLQRHDHAVCWAMRDQLAHAVDDKGVSTRPLTEDEATFILHERLLVPHDFRYWAERYAVIVKESQDAESLFPLWESQELFLEHVGHLEATRLETQHPDGILVNVLKARQLGLSSLTEMILTHRLTTQTSVRGLVAADTQEQSRYMFSMTELA